MELISEPAAVMINELFTNSPELITKKTPISQPLYYVIFDIGGGTSDLTVAEIKHCKKLHTSSSENVITTIQIIATTGDSCLGGSDITNTLTKLATTKLVSQYKKFKAKIINNYTNLWIE